ncbi:transcription-repair coupling factor [Buchnera aphidicola (Cinara tujafilina)]|uniref:Transcription-repair coupling factor n=1 Tax=Buchnera aphidicola (Cinara tujafilina) TaxID=261317 RepID=F7WZB5_9GAMM|nr:DEAD/DEAH box helicase [Buchnera aphidicola]AEH39775.1 transcription-repair coupling factor [Buchnera aphidicola (Cinara tujafilina)]
MNSITNNNVLHTYYNKKNDFFTKNQLVVHIKYGIGRYTGLCVFNIKNIINEYIIITYAKNEKLYVPITSLSLVTPYQNTIHSNVQLNTLSDSRWKKNTKKIEKKICDTAVYLLDLYSRRLLTVGFSFIINPLRYKKFCKSFPFNLTADQNQSIKQVLHDMNKNHPMDRLICGDVGFGKTEVAMRAIFIALDNIKQVALLVPTTLLAQQHYYNIQQRFKKYPYIIKLITRLTKKKRERNKKKLKNGEINLLIGTHKILSTHIQWKNLGLLIVDEEHRFGVYHKENIKKRYLFIDILTLTATPIPRTLHFSLLGLRDLSIISQPIQKRVPVKTFVEKYDLKIIRNIILKELKRNGQVYYLFNSVKKIEEKTKILSTLIPEAKFCISHGKMSGNILNIIMHNFLIKRFNVLVCTTIIDTGLDISNVNTIIIENSDKFGLSQLHQLRGRVGRAAEQAYAWFFISDFKTITTHAKKRLEIIRTMQTLGSGLKLSKYDYEMRGVGNILGDIQSGHINCIGLYLYTKILSRAIQCIKNNKKITELLPKNSIKIKLHTSALLPEKYISNINTRLSFYRKITHTKNIVVLNKIKIDLFYLFGELPIHAKNLFLLHSIKIISQFLGIKRIESRTNSGYIIFSKTNKIDVFHLSQIIVKRPEIWKFHNNILYFNRTFFSDYKRLQWIWNFINKIKMF